VHRLLLAASVAASVTLRTGAARADRNVPMLWDAAAAGALFGPTPSLGLDETLPRVGPRDANHDGRFRFLLGGSLQLPLPLSCTDCVHRLIVGGRGAFGAQVNERSGTTTSATFDTRVGYRFIVPAHAPGSSWPESPTAYFGAGSTVELWPIVRPSVSPELGMYVGDREVGKGAFTLGVQADVYFAGLPGARLAFIASVALY
jgi:hypothetical protein